MPGRISKLRRTGLVTLAALSTLLTVLSASPAHAAEPPPGDCWNEALSRDPLHCYFLEEAQRAGEIEVAAVYLAPGGGPLYIFLEQTTPITDDVAQLFEAKAHEWMEKESPAASHHTHECGGYTGDGRKDCLNRFLEHPEWRDFETHSHFSRPLPLSNIYERIVIDVGGSDGRRDVPGWASWRQVWPTAAPGPGGSSGFDVSDVDLTNIPDPDCEDIVSGHIRRACHSWQLDTSVGVAGVYDKYVVHVQTDPDTGRADGVWKELVAVYLQLKVSDPDDEEEMQALRDSLHPDTFGPDWEVITIPVKYDFGELWRWSVILDRFAVSAGNTVGITGAEVTYNTTGHGFNDEPRVWMNGLEPLQKDPAGSDDWDWSTARTILMVWAVDPTLAVAALPKLLPELGIPADSVRLVAHYDTTHVIEGLAIGRGGTVPEERLAIGRVGVGPDGMPNSIDTTSDSYPKRRTETAAVQRIETAGNEVHPSTQSEGVNVDVTGIKANIAGIWPQILTGAGALAVLGAVILITLRFLRRS